LPLAVGDVVADRYTIRGILGEGGAADAYLALDTVSGAVVVVKVPHVSMIGDLAAYGRYQRELDIGRRLDHPGIQRLLDEGGGQRPYMVLEYVDGTSLRTYLHERGRLSVEEVLRLGMQLAEVLCYVHAQGIVHRDLKPENILVSSDGRLKLADFGIALRLGTRRLTFSHLSNAVGTPDYMAPEQVRGERGDARIDIYALGVVLYELLTGCVPYPSDEPLEVMRRKTQLEPPLVRRLRPDVPAPLEAVIYRALRRRPEERYQSMAELRRDLGCLEAVPIPTYAPDIPPPTPVGDLPPWRTTALILAVVFAVLIALGVLAALAHTTPAH
jgi:eukaryotic-like serine/threonine-protein kinase